MSLDVLGIRLKLGRKNWAVPVRWEDGWYFNNKHEKGRVIVSYWYPGEEPNEDWTHASISWKERMPTYEELKLMYQAVFPNSYAYQIFVPDDNHVTYHDHALHLWGRTDGKPVLPEFSQVFDDLGKMI